MYDWKPSVCSKCSTFSNDDRSFPLHPIKPSFIRWHSRSRSPKTPLKHNPTPSTIPPNKPDVHPALFVPQHPPPSPPQPLIYSHAINLNQVYVSSPLENILVVDPTKHTSQPSPPPPHHTWASQPLIASTSIGFTTHSTTLSPSRSFKALEASPSKSCKSVDISWTKFNNKKKGKKAIPPPSKLHEP